MAIEIKNIKNSPINKESIVSLKKMGSIYEVCWCEHRNQKAPILKVDKNHYIINSTGELKESKHIENRLQNKAQLSQSFKKLRELINTNVTDIEKCKWITLTYREQMEDTKRAYRDYDKFIKKFKYKYGKVEYINVCEPCGNGRWHFHCLIIFPYKAPFIPNDAIESMWQHGFTKTQKIYGNIDNVGAYLSAHISDVSLEEAEDIGFIYHKKELKKIDKLNGKKLNKPKYFIKGARLSLYPPNFKLYRTSRGIKKPEKEYMTYKEAKEKIGLGQPTYSKSIKLTDTDRQFNSKIIYEHYNTKKMVRLQKKEANPKIVMENNKITIPSLHILKCFKPFFDAITSIYIKIRKCGISVFKMVKNGILKIKLKL